MNQSKYTQLLKSAAAINTEVKFYDQQIFELNNQTVVRCEDFTVTLDLNTNEIAALENLAELNVDNVSKLHAIKAVVEAQLKEINKDFLKRLSGFEQKLNKAKESIHNIRRQLVDPCQFDLGKIRTMLSECDPLIATAEQRLNSSLQILNRCETTLGRLLVRIRKLDLPAEIEATKKHVDQVADDFGRLSIYLGENPPRAEFLPLRQAWSKLVKNCEALFPADLERSATAENPNPGPGNRLTL